MFHERHRLTDDTQFFPINDIVEIGSLLPNTLPPVETFREHMEKMRIRRDDHIICYDMQGMSCVARAAWMFRYFGVQNVLIMNGGL